MKTRNNPFSHIDSFKALETEKMHIYYKVKLSQQKIDIRLMELSALLNPVRFIPILFSEMARPLLSNLKHWFKGLFHGHKQKPASSE